MINTMNKSRRLNLRMGDLCVDIGWVSINKKKEKICGDYFHIVEEADKHILVLSDGLGSGIKANVLSTLTARMLSKMIAGSVNVRDAVSTLNRTLPVCSVRQLAYATFTILDFQKDALYLLQYDNPDAILLRRGKVEDYPVYCLKDRDNEYHESMIKLQEEDMLILMSDGITSSGIGETTNGGWGREEVAAFCQMKYRDGMNAREMAYRVTGAGLALNTFGINDDMTTLVLRICKPQILNLMIGPPQDKEQDRNYMEKFFHSSGKHVICGGTTAKLAEKYLGSKLSALEGSAQNGIPSAMQMKGVDYITEGQLTLQRLLEYCEEWEEDPLMFYTAKKRIDPAERLMEILFCESTHIRIFFGKADNSDQEEYGLNVAGKQKTVEKLISHLKKQGRDVQIVYWAT